MYCYGLEGIGTVYCTNNVTCYSCTHNVTCYCALLIISPYSIAAFLPVSFCVCVCALHLETNLVLELFSGMYLEC